MFRNSIPAFVGEFLPKKRPLNYLSRILDCCRLTAISLIVLIVTYSTALPAMTNNRIEQQRKNFLLAEQFISKGDGEAFSIIRSSLQDYPLYPYLVYQWLKDHLDETDSIEDFLRKHQDTRYAGLLRGKWLTHLAEHQRWAEFVQYYVDTGNSGLACQLQWAHFQLGHQTQALTEAKKLWLSGHSQPAECESLFSALVTSPLMTSELIWRRFVMALQSDNVLVAESLSKYLGKDGKIRADEWLRVHRTPTLIESERFSKAPDQQISRLFAHGAVRLMKTDVDRALIIWDARKQNLQMSADELREIERKLALSLAHNRKMGAYQRLRQLPLVDAEIGEWLVRSAVFEQDWQHINEAIALLPEELRNDPRWQYWQARSLAMSGETDRARQVYSTLAKDRSFWGFLAADAVGSSYALSDRPVLLAANELATLAELPGFQAARELKIVEHDQEAERQWWFAVSKLSNDKLKAAAKLAQSWRWDQLAIKTLVKADYWDDLPLRFPLNYLDLVQTNAERQRLEPALVFGLMRQESMLDNLARSSVGALGLMQIMPKTGRQIAQELNERWLSDNSLFEPETNIRFGSFYYKKMLNKFDGHVALATAAYNAGPARVQQWRPIIGPVSADIWIENIPFKETRKYVTSVMAYMIIYQHRIQRGSLRLKNMMKDVLPG